ncbi:hypothetical protein [Algicola sagamiensis]|uniref:hypothetical protein n=1 Tax=Algicola sagamiensis TaxID=163869 RepID=UPI0003736F06|nr:hypothetical protein [Algicola sagamiensis]
MMQQINLTLETPLVTFEKWAEQTGQSVRAVREQVKAGKWPTYTPPSKANEKQGRRKKYINVFEVITSSAKSCGMEVQVKMEGAA